MSTREERLAKAHKILEIMTDDSVVAVGVQDDLPVFEEIVSGGIFAGFDAEHLPYFGYTTLSYEETVATTGVLVFNLAQQLGKDYEKILSDVRKYIKQYGSKLNMR